MYRNGYDTLLVVRCSQETPAAETYVCHTIANSVHSFMHLFNCELFNDAINNSYSIASNDWMILNDEWQRTWMEQVVIYFRVVSRYWPRETEENYENLSQDSRFPGRDSNPASLQRTSRTLSLEETCSVT
jgi:hypothetical protein